MGLRLERKGLGAEGFRVLEMISVIAWLGLGDRFGGWLLLTVFRVFRKFCRRIFWFKDLEFFPMTQKMSIEQSFYESITFSFIAWIARKLKS